MEGHLKSRDSPLNSCNSVTVGDAETSTGFAPCCHPPRVCEEEGEVEEGRPPARPRVPGEEGRGRGLGWIIIQ